MFNPRWLGRLFGVVRRSRPKKGAGLGREGEGGGALRQRRRARCVVVVAGAYANAPVVAAPLGRSPGVVGARGLVSRRKDSGLCVCVGGGHCPIVFAASAEWVDWEGEMSDRR